MQLLLLTGSQKGPWLVTSLVKPVMMLLHVLTDIWVSFMSAPHKFWVWISSIIRKNITLISNSLLAASVLVLSFGYRILSCRLVVNMLCLSIYISSPPPFIPLATPQSLGSKWHFHTWTHEGRVWFWLKILKIRFRSTRRAGKDLGRSANSLFLSLIKRAQNSLPKKIKI